MHEESFLDEWEPSPIDSIIFGIPIEVICSCGNVFSTDPVHRSTECISCALECELLHPDQYEAFDEWMQFNNGGARDYLNYLTFFGDTP